MSVRAYRIYLCGILIAGWLLQRHAPISQDVFAFAEWAQKLLHGGTYAHDYFETNPPLVIYLSIPPVLIANVTGLNLVAVLYAYYYVVTLCCLWVSASVMKRLMDTDQVLAQGVVLLLALIWLSVPQFMFGQREDLMAMLGLPYVLAAAAWQDQKELPTWLLMSIGLMAGIGFALKPFFLVIPLVIEVFLLLRNRCLATVFRVELAVMILVMVCYAFIALHNHPDYFQTILPFMLRYYYVGLAQPISVMLSSPFFMMGIVSIIYYWMRPDRVRHQALATLLLVLLIGSSCSYLLGGVSWIYHTLPTYFAALLLFGYLILEQIHEKNVTKTDYHNALILSLLLIVIVFLGLSHFGHTTISLIMATAFMLMSMLLLIFRGAYLYVGCQPAYISASMVFTVSVLLHATANHYLMSNTSGVQSMRQFLSSHYGGRYLYFINTSGYLVRPLAYEAGYASAARWPFLWMLPGMLRLERQSTATPAQSSQVKHDKLMLASMMAEDINRYVPAYVLVDAGSDRLVLGKGYENFNYLAYFSESPAFAKVMLNYQLTDRLTLSVDPVGQPLKAYDVYKRKV